VGTESICRGFSEFVVKRLPSVISTPRRKDGNFLWSVTFVSQRARQVAELLYSGNGPCLPRKQKLAQEFIEKCQPFPFINWNKITRYNLVAMREQLGSWNSVASEIGVKYSALMVQKTKRYGIRR
jgi:hypothetical protein